MSGSDPCGHGDHEGLVSGSALALLGARRAGTRSGTGTGTCSGDAGAAGPGEGGAISGEAVCRATGGFATVRRTLTGRSLTGRTLTGRTSACAGSSAVSCSAGALDAASAAIFFAVLGRALGGCRCHTRADTMISSFSANGAIRHQVRGSAT